MRIGEEMRNTASLGLDDVTRWLKDAGVWYEPTPDGTAISLIPNGAEPIPADLQEAVKPHGPALLRIALRREEKAHGNGNGHNGGIVPLRPVRADPATGEVFEYRALTDLGNRDRLRDKFGDRIRYCAVPDAWLIWDGTRWKRDDKREIYQFAAETVLGIYAEAATADTAQQREAIAKHAVRSEAAPRIEAMVSLARSLPEIAILTDQLDVDRWALNCMNGTLDLRTGELRPHDPADLITKICPVVYDPAARHPLWERFLADATGGDDAFARFLQRAAGYTLCGEPLEEVMFFPHGPGATGKSTFLDALKGTLGGYAMTADFEAFIKKRGDAGIRTDIARLEGARFVVSVEVDEGKKLAEGLVKMITGGDMVTARELYRKAVEYRPAFTLWLAANHAPHVADGDDAMWRRIIRLPFTNIVPKEKRDPAVKTTLRNPASAGPAILAWAVRGCLEWQRDGLKPPTVVEEATDAYRREMDPIADFVYGCCDLSPQAWTPTERLWSELTVYMSDEADGAYTLTKKGLADRLKRFGCTAESRRWKGKLARGWRGIALQEDDTPGGDALPIDEGVYGCNSKVDNSAKESSTRAKLTDSAVTSVYAYTDDPPAAGVPSGDDDEREEFEV